MSFPVIRSWRNAYRALGVDAKRAAGVNGTAGVGLPVSGHLPVPGMAELLALVQHIAERI